MKAIRGGKAGKTEGGSENMREKRKNFEYNGDIRRTYLLHKAFEGTDLCIKLPSRTIRRIGR